MNRMNDISDRASEGLAAGVYGAGFTMGSQTRVRARGGLRGAGDQD